MTRLHLVLLCIVASYVVAIPFIRKLQAGRDEMSPHEAFGMWLLWPLVLVLLLGTELYVRIPKLLFPKPQVTKVRERLRASAEKAEKEEQQ